MSMVSMSMTWMSQKPSKARLARISQPNPPAPVVEQATSQCRPSDVRQLLRAALPMTRILQAERRNCWVDSPGTKPSGSVKGPARVRMRSTCL